MVAKVNDKEAIQFLTEMVERQTRTLDQLIAMFNRQINLTDDSLKIIRRLMDNFIENSDDLNNSESHLPFKTDIWN